MSSKQQSPRQSQSSPRPSQNSPQQSQTSSPTPPPPTRPFIFSNFSFHGDEQKLLRDLKRKYLGVAGVSLLYLRDNDGNSIDAIRIELKADDLVKQFLDKSSININDEQYSIHTLTKSLIVSKIASSEKLGKILQDLGHNYLGIEKISRFCDINGHPIGDVRIDFTSDSSVTKILKDKYILIDGKRRSVQPYWSLVYESCQDEKVPDSKQSQKSLTEQPQRPAVQRLQPQKYLTEQRVKELFNEQQMHLEAMINAFDSKWSARLSSLTNSSANANVDPLLAIFKDLTTVCQQFNQQNGQIQRQLGSIVNRVQDVQMKLHNEQEKKAWPQLPIQNGH